MIKLKFAVDVDGTLAESLPVYDPDVIGPPFPGAKEFLLALKELGSILIYTCRTSEDCSSNKGRIRRNAIVLRGWLKEHDLYYDYIWEDQIGKPIADFYIDDKAITCRPNQFGLSYQSTITRIKELS